VGNSPFVSHPQRGLRGQRAGLQIYPISLSGLSHCGLSAAQKKSAASADAALQFQP
jgi:hypothetical protein